MRNRVINEIDEFLDNAERTFISEVDLQVHLAMFLKEKLNDKKELKYNVLLEYPVDIKFKEVETNHYPWNNGVISIDIIVESPNKQYLPIEIKYKTKGKEIETKLFGEDNNRMKLKDQGARSNAKYDFWKDVKRIELLEIKFENVVEGIALFVTNDKNYKMKPRNTNVQYYNFRIDANKNISKEMYWNNNTTDETKKSRPNFKFEYNYNLAIKDIDNSDFYYIVASKSSEVNS